MTDAEIEEMDARRVGVYVSHHLDPEVVLMCNDVGALAAALRDAREVVKSVEWSGRHPRWGCDICLVCGGFGPARPGMERPAVLGGHAPSCRLAAVLGVLTGRENFTTI